MGEMRDSDWSRENLLRSDWLLLIGAIMTTNLGKQTTANNVSNRMAHRTVENLYITSYINVTIQFYL